MGSRRPLLAGIDGCKGGWVCALRHAGSSHVDIMLLGRIDEILTLRTVRAAIDMPIGFLDAAVSGGRDCEVYARRILGKIRGTSIFSSPCRKALREVTYERASEANRDSGPNAPGLNKQTFAIFPKLRELDAFINRDIQSWLFESHPELAFMALNNRIPVLEPKRTPGGAARRRKLLEGKKITLPTQLPETPSNLSVRWDDVLDAIALTIVAEHHLDGKASRLGGDVDSRGLRMEICF